MFKRVVLGAIIAPFFLVSSAFAVTIVEVHLGGVGQPDIEFVNGVLSTINDGVVGTPGDQNTDALFDSLLNSVADIVSGASFTLDGVIASGAPVAGPNSNISQHTTGGTFSLWGNDGNNTLLLSGTLGQGDIIGSDTTSIGTFFTSQVGSLTGGSLLGLLPANIPVLIGFTLGSIQSAGGPGLDINNQSLGNFTANGTGLIDVVPEPATLSLLGVGLLGGAIARRRKVS